MYLDIKFIHERLNSFDKNIKFTIDKFPDGNVCFLDIQIDYINYKQTHTTGQYTHFHSQTPWPLKTATTKALFHRVKRVCITNAAFNEQIENRLMSWNSHPK